MSLKPRSPGQPAWAGDRHILVPPDIVAVRRQSPGRGRKRTRGASDPKARRPPVGAAANGSAISSSLKRVSPRFERPAAPR